MAISKALEEGAKAVVCGSTGNTSASAAAYAARAGLTCVVLIPDGYIALGKLAQALVHGAKVVQVRGNFDRALELVRELAATEPVTVVNSINPYRIEGQKTGAFEVVDVLGDAPDVHCMPVGNAGNITAYWKGYREYQDAGKVRDPAADVRLPGGGRRPDRARPPGGKARNDRDGDPDRQPGLVVRGHRRGVGVRGPDRRRRRRAILEAYRFLAREESVFCEPASAASVAGLLKVGVPAGSHGRLHPDGPRLEGPGRGHRPDRGTQGGRRRPGGRKGGAGPLGLPSGTSGVRCTTWQAVAHGHPD